MTPRRRSRRERFVFRLPAAVLEYPFEVFMAVAGLLIGVPSLLGGIRPGSLSELLPAGGLAVWGGAVALGGVAVAVGLSRLSPGFMAAGLRLLGGLFVIYAVATTFYAGLVNAGVAAGLFVVIGGLSWFRSLYLLTLAEVGRRIHLGE